MVKASSMDNKLTAEAIRAEVEKMRAGAGVHAVALLHPGDVVILEWPLDVSAADVEVVKRKVRDALGLDCVVLAGGLRLAGAYRSE
jgi:hypothetical protein